MFSNDDEFFFWLLKMALFALIVSCYVLRVFVTIKSLRTIWSDSLNTRVMHVRVFTSAVILGIDMISLFSYFNFFIIVEILVETFLTVAVMHFTKKAEHKSLTDMKNLSPYSSVASTDSIILGQR